MFVCGSNIIELNYNMVLLEIEAMNNIIRLNYDDKYKTNPINISNNTIDEKIEIKLAHL